jgi:hypothetical protein
MTLVRLKIEAVGMQIAALTVLRAHSFPRGCRFLTPVGFDQDCSSPCGFLRFDTLDWNGGRKRLITSDEISLMRASAVIRIGALDYLVYAVYADPTLIFFRNFSRQNLPPIACRLAFAFWRVNSRLEVYKKIGT